METITFNSEGEVTGASEVLPAGIGWELSVMDHMLIESRNPGRGTSQWEASPGGALLAWPSRSTWQPLVPSVRVAEHP